MNVDVIVLLLTAVPAAPLNVTVNQVERVSGRGSVTVTASWIQPSNFELFDIDRYDINVPQHLVYSRWQVHVVNVPTLLLLWLRTPVMCA